ncbi:thiamine pyrophosphate-dependent acetolactate synthase large subunit-like protein [Microbacterium foliorum]|uniref:Thiamine pyrophosphate-dependent acetolactate synthase large subunit-like protein n=1 Tax=Microbacterium foliorum TaxID=104336 RepID=A0ABU1HY77_9MICO|nr:thiamine pyrophosphate-dependent acetolactate synthase large subunit-like protein [Microbacterium foliorum]
MLTFGAAVFRYHQFVDGDLLPPGASLLGVTSDPDEATRAGMGVLHVGDPSDAMERVAAAVDERPAGGDRWEPLAIERDSEGSAPFSASQILDIVDHAKPDDSVIFLEWTSADALWWRLSVDRPRSYFFPASGGLGWGLPAAIGAGMAVPGRPIIALIGDGAMQYTPAALWTAVKHAVPVTFVVCQNEEYGALQRFASVMEVPDAPYLDLPGLAPADIARGYGVEVLNVADAADLADVVAGASSATGPRLVVVPQSSSR